MTTIVVSSKDWGVIPAEIRKKYDLHPGDRVMLVDYGGVLAIVPALPRPIAGSAGLLKGGPSMTKALLAEHTRERRREM